MAGSIKTRNDKQGQALCTISAVAQRFGVSVRTLRYYEDMGLLESLRPDDQAYRAYTGEQLKRLEQILVLRRLDLSIREIQAIFQSRDLAVLLDTLSRKMRSTEADLGRIQGLKNALQLCINSLRQQDLAGHADLRHLLDHLGDLEHRLQEAVAVPPARDRPESAASAPNPAAGLPALPNVRLVALPPCVMVSSGYGNFGDENFNRFDQWFSALPMVWDQWKMPQDFAWYDPRQNASMWWHVHPGPGTDTAGFELLDYEGGWYAAAVSRDGDDADGTMVYEGIKRWVAESCSLELDERPGHQTMFHVITLPAIKEALGYHQLEIFVPVRPAAAGGVAGPAAG